MKQEKWDADNIADQSGRIAIVTGASSGIGYQTARILAEKNAEVILAVRNLSKGGNTREQIISKNAAAAVHVMNLDLADLKSVSAFSREFLRKYSRLDMLINNAGVMMPPHSKTKDGFELQFGTNHLGHFALTAYLINILKKTTASRIVNVSSNAHKYGKLNFDDLNWENRKYKKWNSYSDSKIANIYFTYELQRKIEKNGQNPIAVAAHPGWTATELQRYSGVFEFFNNFFAQNSYMGALPVLYAAVAENVQSGDYIGPSGMLEMRGYPKKVDTIHQAKDEKIAARLWKRSEELFGVKFIIN